MLKIDVTDLLVLTASVLMVAIGAVVFFGEQSNRNACVGRGGVFYPTSIGFDICVLGDGHAVEMKPGALAKN